jgi:hypothetical protein
VSVAYCVSTNPGVAVYLNYSLPYQLVNHRGTNPALNTAKPTNGRRKMKTLLQDLKRAFDAVEFTNVSHLNALNAKLNQPQPSSAEFKIERHNAVSRRDSGTAITANSPC